MINPMVIINYKYYRPQQVIKYLETFQVVSIIIQDAFNI